MTRVRPTHINFLIRTWRTSGTYNLDAHLFLQKFPKAFAKTCLNLGTWYDANYFARTGHFFGVFRGGDLDFGQGILTKILGMRRQGNAIDAKYQRNLRGKTKQHVCA